MEVKVYSSFFKKTLENKVNEFTRNAKINVKDIQFKTRCFLLYAFVIYDFDNKAEMIEKDYFKNI